MLGGYLLLYPKARVHALVPLPGFFTSTVLPAMVFLFIWFGMQIFNVLRGGGGGVAWYAHIGGFIVGLALIKLLESKEHRERPAHEPAAMSFRPSMRRRSPWGY